MTAAQRQPVIDAGRASGSNRTDRGTNMDSSRMAFLRALPLRHLAVLQLSPVLSSIGDDFYAIAVVWIAVNLAGSGAGRR